jgi:hypothetical protein
VAIKVIESLALSAANHNNDAGTYQAPVALAQNLNLLVDGIPSSSR